MTARLLVSSQARDVGQTERPDLHSGRMTRSSTANAAARSTSQGSGQPSVGNAPVATGRTTLPGSASRKGKTVNIVEETDLSETFFVGIVSCESEPGKEIDAVEEDKWTALLQINGSLVTVKLDTGAKANLISLTDIKAMKDKPKIQRKKSKH